jgi:multicomponent Na+:H+ antiporter subunit F
MIVVAVTVTVLLSAAAVLATVRIVRGPSTLDRIVATDVLLAIVAAVIGTEAAYTGDTTALPILVVLALLGATGSVSVARFTSRDGERP